MKINGIDLTAIINTFEIDLKYRGYFVHTTQVTIHELKKEYIVVRLDNTVNHRYAQLFYDDIVGIAYGAQIKTKTEDNMNKLTIVNKTGNPNDTEFLVDGKPWSNSCVSSVKITIDNERSKAELTFETAQLDSTILSENTVIANIQEIVVALSVFGYTVSKDDADTDKRSV